MILRIHPDNPQQRLIQQAVDILRKGGVIIYPTDTVYGLGCDINSKKGIEQICKIKHLNPKKAEFSIVCQSISDISNYTNHINNASFKVLKQNLPGAFTFILGAGNDLPATFRKSKKTIGIRIPDNKIALEIAKELGNPIISTSLNKFEDDIREYYTNPELIYDRYEKMVDLVIDGGEGGLHPSTVVNLADGDVEILRQGLGELVI